MKRQLFATKSLSRLMEEMAGENRLRRVLGPVQLTSLGVGAIIGAGIFVATGAAALSRHAQMPASPGLRRRLSGRRFGQRQSASSKWNGADGRPFECLAPRDSTSDVLVRFAVTHSNNPLDGFS